MSSCNFSPSFKYFPSYLNISFYFISFHFISFRFISLHNGLFSSLSVHVQRLVHHFWITWFIKMFTFTFSAHHFFFKHNNQLISKAFCSEKYTFACSALTLTGSMQCLRRTTFFQLPTRQLKKQFDAMPAAQNVLFTLFTILFSE